MDTNETNHQNKHEHSAFDSFYKDPEVVAIIKMKAKNLSDHPLFRSDDPQHIENDMWSFIFEKCHEYTPSRGTRQAYACMRADYWAAMEIRSRNRHKRIVNFIATSIDRTMIACEGDMVPLSSLLGIGEHRRRNHIDSLSYVELLELREALVLALRRLAPDQREVLDDRIEYGVDKAAEQRGISPSTVRRQIAEMRKMFGNAGLGPEGR